LKSRSRTERPPRKLARKPKITIQTYYRWRKEYGGLKLDQAKRLAASLAIWCAPPVKCRLLVTYHGVQRARLAKE
jgi:hypothetical protein